MIFEMKDRPLAEQIKAAANYRGYTIKKLGEEYNRRFGTKFIQQSFSRKINKDAFSWKELKQLGEILGFELEIKFID